MELDRGVRKLGLQRVRLDDCAARTGRAGADECRKRRLADRWREDAAVAGEIFADRAGPDRALAARPVEVGRPGHQASHVILPLRKRATDDLCLDAETVEFFNHGRECGAAGRGADVAVGDEVDRPRRLRAVGRSRRIQCPDHFRHRVPPTGCHTQHHREQITAATRIHGIAVRSPACCATKALGGTGHTVGIKRPPVAVGLRIEPGGARVAQHRLVEHGHAGERAGGKLIKLLILERRGDLLGEVDPPGKVARIGDAVDLRRESSALDRPQHRQQQIAAKRFHIDAFRAALPGQHEHVDRRHAAQGGKGIGHCNAVRTGGIDDEK